MVSPNDYVGVCFRNDSVISRLVVKVLQAVIVKQ